MNSGHAVVIGLDVGKSGHHACALDPDGTKLFDQPNTIGALPIAVARDCGCAVAYLPGLAMRKAADLYPGRSKTDARDAFIIADTARTMPHTRRAVD